MRALMIITLLTFSVVAHGADSDDTPETRLAAAEKYYATLDIAKLMDQVLAKDAASLPQDNREQARATRAGAFSLPRTDQSVAPGSGEKL